MQVKQERGDASHLLPGPATGPNLVAVRVLADAISLALALVLAFVARFDWGWFAFSEDPDLGTLAYVVAGVVWVAAILRGLGARGLYDEDTLVPGGGEFARTWRTFAEGIAVLAFFAFLIRGEQLSRSWFMLGVVFSAILLPLERLAFRRMLAYLRGRGRYRRPVVLIRSGNDPTADDYPRRLAEFDVVGEVGSEELLRGFGDEEPAADSSPGAFLIDSVDWDRDLLWEVVLAAGEQGASVFVLSGLRTVSSHRVTTRDLEGKTVMRVSPPRIAGFRAVEKRFLDLVGALILALPGLVVGVVIAIVQLVSSGRPILYGQMRLGRDGKEFRMYKFRSMRRDAESDSGPTFAEHDDPRRTRFGGLLRRTSLDELPQIWNVLRGQMSLVGPRPERPEFVTRFSEEMRWYRYRLRIKPGLTGLAQALGLRGRSPLESRIEWDNWYIENWSLALDLQILLRTIGAVVRGTNAE